MATYVALKQIETRFHHHTIGKTNFLAVRVNRFIRSKSKYNFVEYKDTGCKFNRREDGSYQLEKSYVCICLNTLFDNTLTATTTDVPTVKLCEVLR